MPGHAAVCGALKCRAGESAVSAIVDLVLEPVPRSVSPIDRKPFLIAARASVGRLFRPGLTSVGGAPMVVAEKRLLRVRLKAEIKKLPCLIGLSHRIATEDVVLQDAGECPMHAGIGSITPATLAKVRGNIVKLPPGDCHLAAVCGVN